MKSGNELLGTFCADPSIGLSLLLIHPPYVLQFELFNQVVFSIHPANITTHFIQSWNQFINVASSQQKNDH